MGADIHMVVEKRWQPSDDEAPRWVGVFNFPRATAEIYDRSAERWRMVEDRVHWRMRWRNYDLFAALAGVRGDGPEPRGLPEDISDLAAMEVDGWGLDGHSHTWYLLSECLHTFVEHQLGKEKVAELTAKKLQGAPNWDRVDEVLSMFGVCISDADETLDDFRVIIWFDN